MKQKGFATIFSLCLLLIIALIVKGIAEAEKNNAREVSNFELEQALQNAADSGIFEAAEVVRLAEISGINRLEYAKDSIKYKKKILTKTITFKRGEQTLKITVEVWGERGLIYFYKMTKNTNNLDVVIKDKTEHVGVYFVSTAKAKSLFWSEEIHRCAYAYVLSEKNDDGTYADAPKIYFMELQPTKAFNQPRLGVIRK